MADSAEMAGFLFVQTSQIQREKVLRKIFAMVLKFINFKDVSEEAILSNSVTGLFFCRKSAQK